MDKNELLDRLAERNISRRELNKTLAGLGLATVMVPLTSRTVIGAPADHPTVFTWEGYDSPGMHGAYLEKHGESPNFALWGDEEEAFAKMRAGFEPELAHPCSYKIQKWHDAGILSPIDVSRLSNWADVVPSLQNIPGAVIDGERYWVCIDWGQTSVIYREDLVEIEEESWGLLWDERYRGRLSMLDSLIDGVMAAAIYIGAKDPYNMTPEEVEKTREALRAQLPLLRYYANSPTDVQQALASGELVAASAWNDSFTSLRREGHPVRFMNPKEGAMTWTCGLCLMSHGKPELIDRAYDFIDAMMSPEAGAYEMRELGFGVANQKAFDLLSEEELSERGLTRNPDDLLSSGSFQEPIGNERELQEMFEEVKAGL